VVHDGQVWASSSEVKFALEALSSAPTIRAINAAGSNLLSRREMQVVHYLAEGLTNREIGERLGLSRHTIKNYLLKIFDKLGVSNRVELLFLTLSKPPRAMQARGRGMGGPQEGLRRTGRANAGNTQGAA
jgi:DNA-binding CsgD family transcriptional regulator